MDRKKLFEIEQILGTYFRPDMWARMQGKLLYRADENKIDTSTMNELSNKLLMKGVHSYVEKKDGEWQVYVHPLSGRKATPRIWVNILLFIATILTTMLAGALLLGKNYFQDFSEIFYGWKYAFAVLTILTFHEMGHYLAARWHRILVTLPYYIPLFFPAFNFGTMGAFIRIKSPIPNRRALLDVGVAGPIAGFVLSLLFLIIGYKNLPDLAGIIAHVETIHPWDMDAPGANLILGKSILFSFFNDFIADGRLPMNEVYHFPFIFAGWIGLLVTAINLIPIGQLDGGHILYALIGAKSEKFGLAAFIAMFALNMYLVVEFLSFIWILWILLILILIRFKHPPTLDEHVELSPLQRFLGWLCIFIFAVSFIPMPIHIQ